MRDFITCPNCERYISIEDIEAPCQLCGRDMCSSCMRVCPDCGKEVCNNHWSNGLCTVCYRKSIVSSGYTKYKESESDGSKALGVGMMIAGTLETARHKYKLKEERERRSMGADKYDKKQTLEAVFLFVAFVILLPAILTKNIGFMIIDGIFAVIAGFGAMVWVNKRYYSKSTFYYDKTQKIASVVFIVSFILGFITPSLTSNFSILFFSGLLMYVAIISAIIWIYRLCCNK